MRKVYKDIRSQMNMSNGYKYIWDAKRQKYRKAHIVIMERHIKRALTLNELVHHIDGNKLNNCIENLKLMNRAEHVSLHHAGKKHNRKIGYVPHNRLSNEIIAQIRQLRGLSYSEIARRLGISGMTAKRYLEVENG